MITIICILSNGLGCRHIVIIFDILSRFWMPMHTIGIRMVVVSSSHRIVSMTNSQVDWLPVFYERSMFCCNRISSWAVFRTIYRYSIDCYCNSASLCRTLVISVCFRTGITIVTSSSINCRITWNGPFIVLSSSAIITLSAGICRFKVMIWDSISCYYHVS